MADLRLYLTLGLSMVLIAGGGVGMYAFFGWVGTALFMVLTVAILGVMQYFAGGGGSSSNNGTMGRRRQSKGARGGRDR